MPAETFQTSSSFRSGGLASPGSQRKTFLFLVVLAWAIVYLSSLFQPPMLDDADTVHAEAAREMAVGGDWVTLHINGGDGAMGFRYLEKAPLMYWCTAASFKIFGVGEWSARLPIALGVLALLLVSYRLGRRVYGEDGGFYSALVLATGFGPFIFTRILIPDMAVALWLALGFDFFLSAMEQIEAGQKVSRWLCWGIAATMALNVLTKGLIGLVFPVGTIFLFLLFTGRFRDLLKLHLVSSFVVFLLIGAPWHILAGIRNPAQGEARGFFWFYFVNEHILRYLKKRFPADYDTVPLWLFWGLMLVWLMPWTAFVLQALAQVPRRWREWRAGLSRQQQGTLLFAIWMFLVLVFFSFSSRQEYYVIAGIPGLALLLGGWLAKETASPIDSRERRTGRISSVILMVIGAAACIAAVLLVSDARTPPANYDIADLLKKNPQDYELSFGHFLDLTPQAMGAFKVPLLVTGIALAAGTVLNWVLRRANRTLAANLALAAMMVIMLHESHTGLEIFSPILTSKALADAIQANWKLGDVIEDNGDYEAASSINFYTHQQMRILNGRRNNIWYGSTFPDAPAIFDDDQSFARRWQGHGRIFLATDEKEIPGYVKDAGYCRLAEWGGKLVITNEPKPCPARAPGAR
ncbi:MAG TPA: glycosyltransferase family 39 protein [Candidatus Angelobacter sp.]|nr:glycosyltransferase family 39 protein [Candidatus Angelobacter sp.]